MQVSDEFLSRLRCDPANPAEVGRRAKAIRLASGLDRLNFALPIGIDFTEYCAAADGKKCLNLEHGRRITEMYGGTLDFLYFGGATRVLPDIPAALDRVEVD